MPSRLLGRVELHETLLARELERCATFAYSEHYTEFLCGRAWKSCMLWTPGGAVGDNVISHYDAALPSKITSYGEQLPYLRALVERTFVLDRLVFARLAVMSSSVGIPHRDYLELADEPDQAACRLHVPLATSNECYFTEDNIVYRMRRGEVWALDATRVHSSAVLSDIQRVHLLLDFKQTDAASTVGFPVDVAATIPDDSICPREPLTDRERRELLALEPIIDLVNLRDAIGIIVKKHYRRDGGDNFVWNTLREIARQRGGDAVSRRIHELHSYYTMERSD